MLTTPACVYSGSRTGGGYFRNPTAATSFVRTPGISEHDEFSELNADLLNVHRAYIQEWLNQMVIKERSVNEAT